MIPALVLTAGLAMRLRPLSLVRAKAALPVAGEAIARRTLRWLSANGVTEAILNLHHLPHTLVATVGDGSDLGIRVRYSWEARVLGSAGGPRRALPLLAAPTFFIVNGDTLTDVDLPALAAAHTGSGAMVTMAVVPNTWPQKYGGLIADADGAVTGIVGAGSMARSWHFVGVQAVQAEAFVGVPEHVPYESVGALYQELIASRPGSVRVVRTSAEFFDIGTPSDYLATSRVFSARERRDTAAGMGVTIDPTARVETTVLWDHVAVEPGATLVDCIVTDGVSVPANSTWRGLMLRAPAGPLVKGERLIGGIAAYPFEGEASAGGV